ncbi:MAG: hypothetical protein LUD16_11910 [Lachnospiraceae bacterium]|nr:hypothetical protein [Lachnospiraceae bacterium]
MDRLINLLVKFFVFLSRFAPIFSKLGFVDYRDIGDLEKEPKMYILPRYHAQVLSMDARVPNVAISMDERLDNIMQEMGDFLISWLLSHKSPI